MASNITARAADTNNARFIIAEGIDEWEAMREELRSLYEALTDSYNLRSWAAMEASRFDDEGDYETMELYWNEWEQYDKDINELWAEIHDLERALRITATK